MCWKGFQNLAFKMHFVFFRKQFEVGDLMSWVLALELYKWAWWCTPTILALGNWIPRTTWSAGAPVSERDRGGGGSADRPQMNYATYF